MYNGKSKASAIILLLTALLLIGFMIMMPFLRYDPEDTNGWAAIFISIIYVLGLPLIYVGALPFTLVALIFGFKMLRQQDCDKLISYNVRTLIASIVLLPFLFAGCGICLGMITNSQLGIFPLIYLIVLAGFYALGLIARVITIIILKRS